MATKVQQNVSAVHTEGEYMNRFIEGGRLTDRHKNKINTEQTLNRLNQIAKEKVNGQRTNIERPRQSSK